MKELKKVKNKKAGVYEEIQKTVTKIEQHIVQGTGLENQFQEDVSELFQSLPHSIAQFINERVKDSMLKKGIQETQKGTQSQNTIIAGGLESKATVYEDFFNSGEIGQRNYANPEPTPSSPQNMGELERLETSQKPQNDPQGEQKREEGTFSCTKEEREFIDHFLDLQVAGSILGMIPSSRVISQSHVQNTRLVPVQDEVKASDKMFLSEIRENQEVFDLMKNKAGLVFEALEKLLKSKGI